MNELILKNNNRTKLGLILKAEPTRLPNTYVLYENCVTYSQHNLEVHYEIQKINTSLILI